MKQKNQYPGVPYPSSTAIFGQPEDTCELVDKCGTYEIQPTSDTANPFPAIAQGSNQELAKQIQKAEPKYIPIDEA